MTRRRAVYFARITATSVAVWTVSIIALHQAITFAA